MSSCRLMFPGVRSSLAFSRFDLSLLLLVFSLIFTVVSRLLLLYSTVDKTVKDEKFLHSEGHPEKFTELHGEEKREEGDRGDPNEMRWNQKRREQASQ